MKSNIYTRTGDTGTTSLVGGKRVKKTDIRLEAYGSVDELNANLSILASSPAIEAEQVDLLIYAQNKLFNIGAYLATDNPENMITHCEGLGAVAITRLEENIDQLDANLPPLNNFIIPSGTHTATIAHVCRTMCRRCERRVVALADATFVDPTVIKFLNRLSDYLFVLARTCNVNAQIEEKFWNKDC